MSDDRQPCTCLRLLMRRGRNCDAHQLPREDGPAAGPSVVECAANDRRWPLEKEGL